jgi:uncharacterized membrane protein YccC
MLSEQATSESRDSTSSADISIKPNPWQAFWRTLIKFDAQKIEPAIAFRNTLGVVAPLLIGIAVNSPLGGIAVASGAMNVSYSDRPDESYDQRARRMLVASVATAVAVLVGGLIGRNNVTAITVAVAWTFAAGMLVALGTAEGDLGVLTVVMLVIFSAQPLTVERAINAGLLALGGGVLETTFSLALWPVRRYEPERRVLGQLYLELSNLASLPATSSDAASPGDSTAAQETLSTLGQDRTSEGERYRSLLNQAERARLCLLTLGRLRRRMHREQPDAVVTKILNRFVDISAGVLKAIGHSLLNSESSRGTAEWLKQLDKLTEKMRQSDRTATSPFLSALIEDALFQMAALAGQLRSVVDLVDSSTPIEISNLPRTEPDRLATLRSTNTLAILRANLNFRSTAFRHAVRLAACLAIGDILGRSFGLRRSYWLPMTIVIVLKPDFTATFSRGVLRLTGTFAGLFLATEFFHFVRPTMYEQALLIGIFMFSLRLVGPANYGIFVSSISALVVLLVAMTGISPKEVILARGVNTFAGGALALLAYWLWPTWERKQAGEILAQMLDAYRNYFRGVATSYQQPAANAEAELDSLRLAARLARSNVEASAGRISVEPGITAPRLSLLSAMLASSQRLLRAIMALDSGLSRSEHAPAREAFRAFVNNVDLTFYYLAGTLRGSKNVKKHLPDLRENHRRLLESGDQHRERYALVNIETDRITNSLNTFGEQILRWVARKS